MRLVNSVEIAFNLKQSKQTTQKTSHIQGNSIGLGSVSTKFN